MVRVTAKIQDAFGKNLPPAWWDIRGRVRPRLFVSPSFIGYGESIVRGSPVPTRDIRVRVAIPLEELAVRSEPDLANVDVQSLPGDEFRVTIRPKDDLPAGLLDFALVLQPRTRDGVLPILRVPAYGRVVEDVRAAPEAIQLGAVTAGKVIEESVVLRSSSRRPFDVENIEVSDAATTVRLNAASADVKAYRVATRATGAGNRTATVQFTIRQGQSPPVVVSVPINFLVLPGGV
jgi:hypothetical protein